MNYKFPVIRNISDVLPVLKDRKEFGIYEKEGGYTVINYNVAFEDTFPPVKTVEDAILRECRGIIFNTSDGSIMARRYHKFFNVGEREETSPQFVDLSKPHLILEKLDGSMITPLVVDGKIRWGTKMGLTDVALPVEEFVAQFPQYEECAAYFFAINATPIFEWCSRKQKIVVDYGKDELVLTAVRNNITGEYLSHKALLACEIWWNIPVVRTFDSVSDIGEKHDVRYVLEKIRLWSDSEGIVIRFDDGHMLKVKSEWYMQLHHAKDVTKYEKNVLEIILEDKLDDLLPLVSPEYQEMLKKYQKDVFSGIEGNAMLMRDVYADLMLSMKTKEKREFAVHHVKKLEKVLHSFMFGMWDGKDPVDMIKGELLKSCSSINRLENNRWLMMNAAYDISTVTVPSLEDAE
jgi:RNA ligase